MGLRAHVRRQVGWNNNRLFWKKFSHRVSLPWWIAAPSYPIIIGLRTVVLAGAIPGSVVRSLREWTIAPVGQDAPDRPGEFVLVLRTFGKDGSILVRDSRASSFRLLPRVRTAESLVQDAVDRADVGAVIGFHDHAIEIVPDGVRYLSFGHDHWQQEFLAMSDAATAIILLLTDHAELGPNFRWELESIAARRLRTKVVLICAPDLSGPSKSNCDEVVDLMGWPPLRLPPLACYENASGRLQVHPSVGPGDPDLAARYVEAIEIALRTVVQPDENV